MAIRALDFMTKVSSRFAYEILPVATASVIGAMLVNHYGRQPPSPPIVIQAPPSASEDAMVQSLREEHELIASFMKRNQERASDAERSGSAATQVASLAPPPFRSWIRRCPSHDRRRKKRWRGSRQSPRPGKSPRRLRRRRLSRTLLRSCQRPPATGLLAAAGSN